MTTSFKLDVNGATRTVSVDSGTPLLYVLRNDLELSGPQFGCGLSQCGACSVLVDGKEARSCVLPVGTLAGTQLPTLEGLPARAPNGSTQERASLPSTST